MTTNEFTTTVAAEIAALLARVRPDAARPGLLVALSGGPDSVALLLAARRWAADSGGVLAAAHLNHGLRGDDADSDEAFCRDLCDRLDVRLATRRDDPRPLARARGCGLEEAGRNLRRRFFETLLDTEPGLHAAATGHHRDDQTETVLMRLFQGTGPQGLRGMRPVSGRVIHPLLGVGRAEIVAFLGAVGQPWREDVSNAGGDNLRARLRRELLPVVRALFGRGSDEAPARLAELLDDDLELLDRLIARAAAGCRDGEALLVPGLRDLEPALARHVLRHWLRAATVDRAAAPPPRWGRDHLEAVWGLLAEGASGRGVDLPRGLRVVREFDRLRLAGADAVEAPRSAEDYRIVVHTGGPAAPAAACGHGDPGDESTWSLTCPTSALAGNLRVRNWRKGDRMTPLGLDGSKKLSDLLRERRLPASARPGVMVVEDDEGIVWVVGVARAERTRLLPTGGPTVTLTVALRRSPENRGKDT